MPSTPISEPHDERRRALGARGERIAAAHLAARGYEILARNFRTRRGELDVVARDGRDLVFCEVKTRVAASPLGPFGPLASIGAQKRRRLRLMAREWLAGGGSASSPRDAAPDARAGRGARRASGVRFDAIGVTVAPDGRLLELDHLEDAF